MFLARQLCHVMWSHVGNSQVWKGPNSTHCPHRHPHCHSLHFPAFQCPSRRPRASMCSLSPSVNQLQPLTTAYEMAPHPDSRYLWPGPLSAGFELASCHSLIWSWLRVTLDPLCWLCVTEVTPDHLESHSNGVKDLWECLPQAHPFWSKDIFSRQVLSTGEYFWLHRSSLYLDSYVFQHHMLVYPAKFTFSNFIGHLMSPGKYSLQSFLRSHSHYSHSLLRYPLDCCDFLPDCCACVRQFDTAPATSYKMAPGLLLNVQDTWSCPSPPFLVFELASCCSLIQSWLRAAHWSKVGFVPLTDLKLATCYFRSHSVDSASLRWPWTASYQALVGIKTSLSYFFVLVCLISISHFAVSFTFLALALSVQPSQLDPSPLILVYICIDSSWLPYPHPHPFFLSWLRRFKSL